ncbi:MAG: M61 family metallopeptidase [Burkholderiales bacterium]|nr:M61 family metallopeptidase [Burkholderiales bacterium]MDE2431919.1 M61 family metallopeptidase [Burkholderiales bacterium]
MIHYRIEVADTHSHRFLVKLKIERPAPVQRVSLPVWIPGSYLVREFARHLSPIQATQSGKPCRVTAVDKSSWDVECTGQAALTLWYEVYAFDTSVRAAFLDAHRGFFNGTSVFLKVGGRDHESHQVQIAGLPRYWQVATALRPVKVNAAGVGKYEASDYDELVDHPVELGTFWRGDFVSRGVRHEFVVAGTGPDFDGDRLLADTQKIVEAQILFWHGKRKCPFSHYVFMLNAVDDGYGGLEHRQSTALICGRRDLPKQGAVAKSEAYTTLLGLISHEYFHTWNVKRLKPAEFAPYDYMQENHTRLLWFFEGFTSYYDDQFLLRTGLIDPSQYLKLLGKTINQVWATPGRHDYSVAQASFDAWTRYYRPDENTANATVSYYTKGSLVALALDLSLRRLPPVQDQQPTLDGVMLRLWHLSRPIRHEDIAQALADEARQLPPADLPYQSKSVAQAWAQVLDAWTESTADLPIQRLLQAVGVTWNTKPAPLPQRLGVRLSESAGIIKAQAVMRHGVAEQIGLSAGDELLALDQWRIKKIEDLSTWRDETRDQTLLISRDQRIATLTLPAQTTSKATSKKRQPTPAPTSSTDLISLALGSAIEADALTRRKAWLKG